ncbi:preprotein translocase subunit SecG [Candidatus Gracilibacteria bacterium]|nr:preprotein translocase subunit SecG [Candidatus Gracilibacteria bacterium]
MEFLTYSQITLSILFILSVLFQEAKSGFGGALGGSSSEENISFYGNKRGMALFLFRSSIILAILLGANAIAFLFV